MRSLPWLLSAALAVAAGPAGAAGTRVAVVPFDASPELANVARTVADAVARKAAESGFDVMTPAAVAAKLAPADLRHLSRCADDSACLTEYGATLRVERIVVGTLARRGAFYRLALVHADARTGERIGGIEREVPVAARKLQREAEEAAPALLAGGEEPPGILRVLTEVLGAKVTLDDAPAGKTPLARVVRPGRHKIRVELEGYADAEPVWVEVPSGGVVEHRARLYLIPAREVPNASPTEGHGTAVQVVK
jgi:hypothetical protein